METFLQARKHHRCVEVATKENEPLAADLWNAVHGSAMAPKERSFAEAVHDTAPAEHTSLLALDPVAVACAFDLMFTIGRRLPQGASPFELRDFARSGWESFTLELERVRDLAEGFGCDLSSAWSQMREVELARGDLDQVERIARLAGRMYLALQGARSNRVNGVPEEVHSVEQGADIGRLLPSEQVLLTEPLLETVLLERLATRKACQYAVRGSAKQHKGPLVIAVDESGSMHGPRFEWSKAALVALSRVAAAERRAVAVVHFSVSTKVQHLRPNEPSAMLRAVQHFLSGGTAIGLALSVAADEVRALAAKGDKGADIVLISDGVDSDTEGHVKAVENIASVDARLFTIAIEVDIDEASPLRSKAAGFVRLHERDLNDPSSVTRLGLG